MLHHTRRSLIGCRTGERAGVSRIITPMPELQCGGVVELGGPSGTIKFTPSTTYTFIALIGFRATEQDSAFSISSSHGVEEWQDEMSSARTRLGRYKLTGLTPGVEVTLTFTSSLLPDSTLAFIDTSNLITTRYLGRNIGNGSIANEASTSYGSLYKLLCVGAFNSVHNMPAVPSDARAINICGESTLLEDGRFEGHGRCGMMYEIEASGAASAGFKYNALDSKATGHEALACFWCVGDKATTKWNTTARLV